MAWWLLSTLAGLALLAASQAGNSTIGVPAMAVEGRHASAQGPGGRSANTERPEDSASVTRGMGKEAVRSVWGDPAEIRKIRTCFGWQEEWVYRGDTEQFGVSERILLFDEGELLTEIK